jgi:hypothetical protein
MQYTSTFCCAASTSSAQREQGSAHLASRMFQDLLRLLQPLPATGKLLLPLKERNSLTGWHPTLQA